MQSHYVIPSEVYAVGEKKQEIAENYKAHLRSIPCKHFKFGRGECPFGEHCFYAHVNPDGTPAPLPPPKPKRQHVSNPEEDSEFIATLLENFPEFFWSLFDDEDDYGFDYFDGDSYYNQW